MAVTPQELFNVRLPRGLEERPDLAREMGLVVQFNVTGPNGGNWTVDTVAEPASCLPGTREDVQCTIELTEDALTELIEAERIARPNVFMKHILEGDVEIDGDATQAMKLSKIFAVTEPAQ